MNSSKDLLPMIDMMCNSNISMLSSNMIVMDAGEGKSYFFFNELNKYCNLL